MMPRWLRHYHRGLLGGDLLAAIVVTLLLVPQAMAYAVLAGLPPHLGLYASLLPLLAYALLGSSPVLAVGPVALTSVLTANALAPLAEPGSAAYLGGAIMLALLSGSFLLIGGLLRLGQLARLLSHPVISGFVTGAAVFIIIGQLPALLGLSVPRGSTLETAATVLRELGASNRVSTALGGGALLLLILIRWRGKPLLQRLGLSSTHARLGTQIAPALVVLGSTVLVANADLSAATNVVGTLPRGLPTLQLPQWELAQIQSLLLPALIISLIGFVESVAIGQSFARGSGQRIDANAELRALGAANLASGMSGAFPITGGFARTAVNAEAGARTPMAGILTATAMMLVLLFATDLLAALPHAALAALIIVSAWGLMDLHALQRAWRHDRLEGLAFLGTATGVITVSLEAGVAFGVVFSLLMLVWRASHPHLAVLGRVPGTEHFRNIERHQVETCPHLLMLRIDENLVFANAEAVEQAITRQLQLAPATRHLVLVLSSVSHIDETAEEMLEELNSSLARAQVTLHLAEVKGPVMDRLQATGHLLRKLEGQVFLSTHTAFARLADAEARDRPRETSDPD